MSVFHELTAAFSSVRAAFLQSPGVMRLQERRIGVEHYAAYLSQVFHHTRENPQIQALATVYFRGQQRAAIKRFFRHASSEIGQCIAQTIKHWHFPSADSEYETEFPIILQAN